MRTDSEARKPDLRQQFVEHGGLTGRVSGGRGGATTGVAERPVAEHGTSDSEQAVGDRLEDGRH